MRKLAYRFGYTLATAFGCLVFVAASPVLAVYFFIKSMKTLDLTNVEFVNFRAQANTKKQGNTP